jgi:FkbM family methyltransferase
VLPKKKLHRLPVSDRKAVYRLRSGEDVTLLEPSRDQVAKDLVWGKGEPTSRADARVLRLVERWSREASIFLDVGAYSGLFAMVAARTNPLLRAVAFEIAPENYLMTMENLFENDLVRQVELCLCGLSDKPGNILMPRHYGAASHPSSLSLESSFDEGVTIPVATLDSFNFEGSIAMKLDVEGLEWNVLSGARRTIEQHKPRMVCEILPRFQHSRKIEELLRPLGYRFFISQDRGFEEREELRPDRSGRDWIFSHDFPASD